MLAGQALPAGQQIVVKLAGVAGNHHLALYILEQREQIDVLIVGQLTAVFRAFVAGTVDVGRIDEEQGVRHVLYADHIERVAVLDQYAA